MHRPEPVADREMPAWYQQPAAAVLAALASSWDGLSEAEAARRYAVYGPNTLPGAEGAGPLATLLRQVLNPLMAVLLAAGLVSVLVASYADAIVIFLVVAFDVIVGFIQEYRAEQALRALARLAAPRAVVIRSGIEREIDARLVVPGDVIILTAGAEVPADARLLRAADLRVDESILTGESLPVSKTTTPLAAPDLAPADQLDMVFMGTSVVRGRGAAVVVATGPRTVLGGISRQIREAGEPEVPLFRRLRRLTGLIAGGTAAVTALVLLLGLLRGEPPAAIFLTAVATAVATVPEGLPITVTLALAVGVWRMARRRTIVRRLAAVETLGSCTTICTDKTGTLTRNEMTVTALRVGGRLYQITGVGYAPNGQILLDGRPVDVRQEPGLALALRIGLLCNEADLYREDQHYRPNGDPTEVALIVAALKGGLDIEWERESHPLLDEIPFDPERQYMATLHGRGSSRLIFLKGAPERIIARCDHSWPDPTTPFDRTAALRAFEELARQGLRVLALACRPAPPHQREIDHHDVASGLCFVGLAGMIDPPRPEAAPAVEACRAAGIRVIMITGDHRVTARAIAQAIGILRDPAAPILDGHDLATLPDQALLDLVPRVDVYARARPEQKLRIVRLLQRQGEIVAVTGDGINDAPALKQADIGIAMGSGTDVARSAADMVLVDDNFATIPAAVREGRAIFDNIRKVILFLIPTGLGLVLTVIASILLGLPLPFLPAQAIWINLVTNGTQDIAMAFEPPEPDIARRPPRPPTEGILTPLLVRRIILVGTVIAAGTLAVFARQVAGGASLDRARAVAMTTMVLYQNLHVFNSRVLTRFFFQANPLTNPFLFLSVLGALALQLLALTWWPLRLLLHTAPLDPAIWLEMVGVATTVLLAETLNELVRRWLARRSTPAARG